ncbi:MAG TPA: amidase [Anaerolineales bacterium]|nr:amidase [Anaerolineales bacterium]
MAFSEYGKYDGLGLAELVRKKKVSPGELVEEAISRIETHNPKLNAVVYKLYEQARAKAKGKLPDGPFLGVPFLMKDLLASLEGVPTSNGNKLWRNVPATVTTSMAERWEDSGVIVVGKTNTPEFGLTPYTESDSLGPACNPWDTSCTTGGSSGGSGAAVASRMVPLASGGDGGGSIRIPSSACGLFGLKPTRGRTPTGPIIGEAWNGFAIEHVLTRSVRDSAAMLDATKGPDVGAPYVIPEAGPFLKEVSKKPGKLRIAFSTKPMLGKNVHADCVRGVEETVALLKQLGHEVVEDTPVINGEEFSYRFLTVLAGQIRADIEDAAEMAGKKVSVDDFDVSTFGIGLFGTILKASDYARSMRYLQSVSREIGRFFENYDALLTPVLNQPPVKIGALKPSAGELSQIKLIAKTGQTWILDAMGIIKPLAAQTYEFIPWTPVFNVTGQPAMSVPLHWNDEGLPIGMHFVGKWGDEATLFRLAGQLEKAKPWFGKAPAGY